MWYTNMKCWTLPSVCFLLSAICHLGHCADFRAVCPLFTVNKRNTVTGFVNSTNFHTCRNNVTQIYFTTNGDSRLCEVAFTASCPTDFRVFGEHRCRCRENGSAYYVYELEFFFQQEEHRGVDLRITSDCHPNDTYNFTYNDCTNINGTYEAVPNDDIGLIVGCVVSAFALPLLCSVIYLAFIYFKPRPSRIKPNGTSKADRQTT